jgi:hypothetical protein
VYLFVKVYDHAWLYWLQLQAQFSEDHLLLRKLQEEEGHAQEVLEQELHKQRQQLELHIAHLNESHQEVTANDTLHKNRISMISLKVQGLCLWTAAIKKSHEIQFF